MFAHKLTTTYIYPHSDFYSYIHIHIYILTHMTCDITYTTAPLCDTHIHIHHSRTVQYLPRYSGETHLIPDRN